jgi:hypothetical protein
MKLNQTLSCPPGIAIIYAGTQYGLNALAGPSCPFSRLPDLCENIVRLRQPLKCAGCFANLETFT